MSETKKTETKRTQPEPEAPTRSWQVPQFLVDLQRRALEGQRTAFDATYGAVASWRESQEDLVTGMLESSRFVPKQLRLAAEEWVGATRSSRETFRETVEKSFSLYEEYLDSLGRGGETATGA